MLKLAGEHNVDLDLVEGTGANGRITRKDILKLVELKYSASRCAKKEEAVAAVVKLAGSTKSDTSSAKVEARSQFLYLQCLEISKFQ